MPLSGVNGSTSMAPGFECTAGHAWLVIQGREMLSAPQELHWRGPLQFSTAEQENAILEHLVDSQNH